MNQQIEQSTVSDEVILCEDAVVLMPNAEDEASASKPSKRRNKPSRRNIFKPFLALYSLVLLVLISLVLFLLNSFLVKYEAATPNAALDQYVEWLRTKNYMAIYEASAFEETALNDKDSYLKYLARIYSGDPKEITLRERPTKDDNQKQFSVYFDDKRVSILDLIPPKNEQTAWRVVPQLVYQKDFIVYASSETRVTVNGEDLSLLGIEAKAAQESVFYGLKDPALYPKVNAYTLSGLLNPPTIEGLTLAGETCTVIQDKGDPQILHIMSACSEETRLEQEEFAMDAAFTYAKFIARDATRAALQKLIYKETSLYDSIRNFSNSWFSRHESYEFKDVELLNPSRYTDSDFTCEVKFQPYYVRDGKTHKGELVHYRMTFLLIEDEWQMIALTPFTDSGNSDTAATTTTTTVATTTTTHA